MGILGRTKQDFNTQFTSPFIYGTVLCDSVASVHEVRKRMVFAETYTLHSLKAIFKHRPEKTVVLQLTVYF